MIELLDDDILVIEKIVNRLKAASALPKDIDAFDRRIVEMFGEAGYRVEVKWWHTAAEGVYAPDIEIVGFTENRGAFDHDRQVWNVVNNKVGLPDAQTGFIPVNPKELEMLQTGNIKKPEAENGQG